MWTSRISATIVDVHVIRISRATPIVDAHVFSVSRVTTIVAAHVLSIPGLRVVLLRRSLPALVHLSQEMSQKEGDCVLLDVQGDEVLRRLAQLHQPARARAARAFRWVSCHILCVLFRCRFVKQGGKLCICKGAPKR